MHSNKAPVPELALVILAYLLDHPSAKDTLQGIAEWWLLKQRVDSAVEDISEALRYLTAIDFVNIRPLTDGEVCYQMNINKLDEITRFVDSQKKKRDG